ncbi:MAG: hypothetical protein JRJ84_09955 [Deltaproteobacteria bacterium]|nr:hypothetical protein [Deltaproteobacteria bacterium]
MWLTSMAGSLRAQLLGECAADFGSVAVLPLDALVPEPEASHASAAETVAAVRMEPLVRESEAPRAMQLAKRYQRHRSLGLSGVGLSLAGLGGVFMGWGLMNAAFNSGDVGRLVPLIGCRMMV